MLGHQLGTAEESTYGTPVTVNRFYEVLPGESLDRNQTIIQSRGLRPGIRHALGSRRALVQRSGGGTIPMEIATTDFGRWFKHMLGGTPSIAQQAATAAYLQTFTPGALPTGLTIQKGVEQVDGTVKPFTFHGCKIPAWEISISRGGIAQLSVDIDAEDVDVATALATASYTTGLKVFHFAQATLKKDTVAIAGVSDANIRGTNALDTERFFLGTSGLKETPLETDFRTYSGSIKAEFRDLATFYNAFAADTSLQLDLVFTGDAIEGAYDEELTITLHDVRFTGEAPKITGPEPGEQTISWEAFEQDDGDAIQITYQSTDTAI